MEQSPAVCITLLTDMDSTLETHCSLCLFFHENDSAACSHHSIKAIAPRAASVLSDSSFYTARSSETTLSARRYRHPSSITSSRSTITSRPSLRRKMSPTEVSLRDLRAKHEQQSYMRTMQSDEQLQQLYESQIMTYLNRSVVDLGSIVE